MTHSQAGLDDATTAGAANEHESENVRIASRSPHPYRLPAYRETHPVYASAGDDLPKPRKPTRKPVKSKRIASTTASSESGTEADDETERQNFVKALPPPNLRPRKGLKDGERDEDSLLTPSQLDEDGRPLEGEGYFSHKESLTDKEERQILFKRRINEFARRCSELALTLLLAVLVLCGHRVRAAARQWVMELLSHVLIMVGLILAYPIRLSLLDTGTTITKPWQRFRVPVSFDPATVLYPPVLPVLVALSVSPVNPAIILPNIILGLSALPQRLFPRSSRLGGFNSLHWLVSILPLTFGSRIKWTQAITASSNLSLSVETLVSLYPLHHSLLTPLHYLTTSSLLVSELHLLSSALINLLLFASAPQAVILKACLWVGGATLFVATKRVLHWNVTLARVPRWKLRQPGHADAERRSLVDAVAEIINLQRATKAFQGPALRHDSDADDDHDTDRSIKDKIPNGSSQHSAIFEKFCKRAQTLLDRDQPGIASADEHSRERKPDTRVPDRGRRYTLPSRSINPETAAKVSKKKAKKRGSHIPWCLRLTVKQAHVRKVAYAAYTYAVTVAIILIPVRYYVGRRALYNREPIGWALAYLFGQFNYVRDIVAYTTLDFWIPLPSPAADVADVLAAPLLPLDIPGRRELLGAALMRLVIIGYWLLVLALGLAAVFTLTPYVEVDTRRKIFHGVMVAMFMPAMFIDPCFCALAVSLVLAIFLILEVIRAAQVPPFGTAIGRFIAPYVDGRDLRGPVVVSHLFLLIGCAVPLWFSLAGLDRQDDGTVWRDWETRDQARDVGMLSGVICVGMGDAAASLIGRRYGRRKWPWVGGKSLEGSAAFAVAVTGGLMLSKVWLLLGGWYDVAAVQRGSVLDIAFWAFRALFCACGASFMEAVLTGANDNVVVPVALWLLVRGTRL